MFLVFKFRMETLVVIIVNLETASKNRSIGPKKCHRQAARSA